MLSSVEEVKDLEKEDDKEKKPGILSVVDMDTNERELFLDYMDSQNPSLNASYIFAILGDDQFLKFFDVMSGSTIKVPSRDSVLKIINYVKVYNYCQQKGFTREAYEKASKVFGRRVMSIQRIVEKVDRVLRKGDLDG